MKNLTILVFCIIPILGFSQTNNFCNDSKHLDPVILNFVKNDSGEIVLKINGHFQEHKLQINGVDIGSLYKEDSSINLTQAGFESAFLSLDTAGGKSASSNPDTQTPVIPPVMSAVNPPLATPY